MRCCLNHSRCSFHIHIAAATPLQLRRYDVCRCYRSILDLALDILLLVGKEIVSIAGASDVVLAHQAIQRATHLLVHGDLVQPDIVCHQDDDVVEVGLDVIHIAHQIQELQYIRVLRFDTVAISGSTLAALDHTPDGAFEESVDGIIEEIERSQCVFVFILDLLGCLLETGEHGTLAAREVFAGITVLPDLCKDLLHQDELIRHKRKVLSKLASASVSLNVQNGIGEGEQVPKHRIVGVVDLLQIPATTKADS